MKNMLKYRLALIGLLVTLLTISFSSCSDEESYDFLGDSGKVYVRLQSSNMVNSVHNVVDTKISKTKLGIFGDAVAAFPVRSTMPVDGSLQVTCDIDNSLIEGYNAKHKTDYLKMDASMIIISGQNLTIENGQMESKDVFEVKVNSEKIESLKLGEYLIPIRLMSVTGSMEVSENWNTVYMHVSIVDDPSTVPFADRTDWTIADCSSEEVSEQDNTPASDVLDGDWGTIWHTEWAYNQPSPPHHITIDMGKVVTMAGFQYVTRQSGTGAPQGLTVEVSVDNRTWLEAATYTAEELPTGGWKEFKAFFEDFKEARYFRLTITETKGSVHYTSLAEVNAFVANK